MTTTLLVRHRPVRLPARLPAVASLPVPPRTLAAHLPAFLGWLGTVRGRKPLTVEQYHRDLRQFIPFCEAVGRPMPDQLDHRVIEAYLGWLQSPERGLTAASASQHLHAIRGFCASTSRARAS